MSSRDRTETSMFPFWWKMCSLEARKTSGKSRMTPTVGGERPSIPRASWFMDLMTLALRTVWGRGRRQFNRWTQMLRSGKNKQRRFWGELFFRGAGTKTELSVVDKIELARTYEPMTGKQIEIQNSKWAFLEHLCFTVATLRKYAKFLESLACPLRSQQTFNGKHLYNIMLLVNV